MFEAGWTEPAFCPAFENKVVEDRRDYEVVQDIAGRFLLWFKGRRVVNLNRNIMINLPLLGTLT